MHQDWVMWLYTLIVRGVISCNHTIHLEINVIYIIYGQIHVAWWVYNILSSSWYEEHTSLSTVVPLLEDTLERTPFYKGHKFFAASSVNACGAPSHQMTPL